MTNKNLNLDTSTKTCKSDNQFTTIIWSFVSSFIGIYLIAITPKFFDLSSTDYLFLVGSFGASAVLLFAAPKVNFAQPRNLIGGHVFSAIIGVTIYKFIHLDISVTAALAVSISIVVMQLTKTTHPPGGATALIAVNGSSNVHELGYLFVLTPIALGVLIMLVVALVINNISKDPLRQYPKYWL